MKILFDHQVFWFQQYGGISRYFVELMERLNRCKDIDIALSLWYSENQHLLSSRLVQDGLAPAKPRLFDLVKWGQQKTKKDLIGFFDYQVSKKALNRGDFDIFHPTYYYPYFLDRLGGRPFVLTVYDMTHEMMSDLFRLDDPTPGNKKRLAERAERVIAISHATKKDLVRICGIDPNNITVVHLASSLLSLSGAPLELQGLPERYVLFTGKRGGYKNFELLARAMVNILKEDASLHIVCGGGGPLTEAETMMLKEIGIVDRVVQVGVNDKILASLYSGAVVFVFPSLYEGFGIPLLEAFECGCPVIASDRSSFPEVVGDAGLLFDPTDESALEEAIRSLLTEEHQRLNLIEKGRRRAGAFTWERVVEDTLTVYRGIT